MLLVGAISRSFAGFTQWRTLAGTLTVVHRFLLARKLALSAMIPETKEVMKVINLVTNLGAIKEAFSYI